jgi:hypothetical protein
MLKEKLKIRQEIIFSILGEARAGCAPPPPRIRPWIANKMLKVLVSASFMEGPTHVAS